MYIKRPNHKEEKAFYQILSQAARNQNSEDGVVAISQSEIMENSDGLFKSSATISGIFNYYINLGLASRIRKGSVGNPGLYNLKGYLEHFAKEEEVVETAPAVETNKPTVQFKEQLVEEKQSERPTIEVQMVEEPVSVQEIQVTLQDMLSYIQALPKELSGSLADLQTKVEVLDDGKLKEAKKENERLQGEVGRLQKEMENLSQQVSDSHNVNEHKIYRSRNRILDELDRFLSYPGWKQKTVADNFRMNVEAQLNNIIYEIGIKEPVL